MPVVRVWRAEAGRELGLCTCYRPFETNAIESDRCTVNTDGLFQETQNVSHGYWHQNPALVDKNENSDPQVSRIAQVEDEARKTTGQWTRAG